MKKFKILVALICSIAVLNVVEAKTIYLKECEYTKEYIDWLKLSDEDKKNTYMPVMCKNSNNDKFHFVGNGLVTEKAQVTDSRFNLKDYGLITSVKNQENTMACWAFATNASIESNLLVNNLGEYDLSEAHLELSTQKTYDYGRHTFNRVKDYGGTYYISSAYLMNSWGPATETYLPFSRLLGLYKNETTITSEEIVNNQPTFDVNSIAMLGNEGSCSDDSINDIKEYLISKGALATTVYPREDITYNTYQYYDGKSYTNLNGETVAENQPIAHAITIVGWDDTISKEKFYGDNKPSRDGAWIIKNSYGEKVEFMNFSEYQNLLYTNFSEELKQFGFYSASDITEEFVKLYISEAILLSENQVLIENDIIYVTLGDNGYQYVSYDDVHVCNGVVGFFDTDNQVEDNSYYYDDLGVNSALTFKDDTGYLVSVFDKKEKSNEELKEIGLYFAEINQNYEIYFANGDEKNIQNAIKIAEGQSKFVGYSKIEVEKEIIITEDKFSIIVKLFDNNDDNQLPFGISRKFALALDARSIYNSIEFVEGVQFVSLDGINYSDVTTNTTQFHLSIKAYTNVTSKEVTPDDENTNNPSETPDTPSNPTETPDTPSNPTETPDTPSNPTETPDTPSNPTETPDTPSNPAETPDTPSNPTETPDTPSNPTETPDTPNTDAEIEIEDNEYNKNENENVDKPNGSVDTPIPDEEVPQTGLKISLIMGISLLLITSVGYYLMKNKNKMFKI